jgi:hypothetical protein
MNVPAPSHSPHLIDRALVWSLALLNVVFLLLTYRGYGYFRDELYFNVCGHHLDWGYVDQPPLVAVAAWLGRHLFGDTLFAVRFFPAVLSGVLVWLAAAIARGMGGKTFAQFFACLAVLTAPLYVGMFSYLSTDTFQPIAWMGCAYITLRILNGESPKLWLVFGLVAGLGLEWKHAMLFFGAAFFAALLLVPERRAFREKWILLGGLVAFLIFLPNLIWEYRHNWATYELLQNIAHSGKNVVLGPGQYFLRQVVMLEPFGAPLWLAGLVWLFFARGGKRWRVLAWTYVILFVLFVAMKAKDYYLGPAYPMLFAAGAVALERWTESRRRWLRTAYAVLLVMGGLLLAPFAKPLLPVEKFIAYEEALHLAPHSTENIRLSKLPQQYADSFGWQEMADSVAAAYNRLTPEERSRCALYGGNYGEAGALDVLGRKYGLPPAISGHQNYFLWGPRGYTGECMIIIGDNRETIEREFEQFELLPRLHNPYAIPYEDEKPIWLCRRPKLGTLPQIWPRVKRWI